MGLTEETDAIAVVVSEETGTISVSSRGRLSRDFDEERLRRFLGAVLNRDPAAGSRWSRARQHLDLSLKGVGRGRETGPGEEPPHAG
jgi:hypothetical protein